MAESERRFIRSDLALELVDFEVPVNFSMDETGVVSCTANAMLIF